MTAGRRQYEFLHGHFVDTWNDGYDDTCDPAEYGEEGWPEMLLEGICGCGNAEVIVEAMAEYLQRVETFRTEHQRQVRYDSPDYLADYLLASMAMDLDLTEHGGGIYTSWLTDAGKRWLELWRTRARLVSAPL